MNEMNILQNYFCVISKFKWENGGRDIQSNSAWSANPYGEEYAIVPDDMVEAIMETHGFCDIELNEDGTEVVSFTALPIPEFPHPEPEQPGESSVWDELDAAYQEGVDSV